MILLIDNYDSFVWNLARYFVQLGRQIEVVRHDKITLIDIAAMAPTAVVLSPGPCSPNEAGICLDLVKQCHQTMPILGVCLGHQVIGQAFGGVVQRGEPVHGRAHDMYHDGSGIFTSLKNPFSACRYHSLIVAEEGLPEELIANAHTATGVIMGLRHRIYPTHGVQFHPESILTDQGYPLLRNFLALADEFGRLANTPA